MKAKTQFRASKKVILYLVVEGLIPLFLIAIAFALLLIFFVSMRPLLITGVSLLPIILGGLVLVLNILVYSRRTTYTLTQEVFSVESSFCGEKYNIAIPLNSIERIDFLKDWLTRLVGLKMVAFKIKEGIEEYKKIRRGYLWLTDNDIAKHSSLPARNYFLARWMPWWRIVRFRQYEIFLLLEKDQANYFQVLAQK